VKYQFDSCSFLWFIQGNLELSQAARDVIDNADNDGSVSVVSFWELSIKAVMGRLLLPMSPEELETLAHEQGLEVLPLTVPHIERFHHLPIDHRDAFDRLLAGIALTEGYTILSPDPAFDTLGVPRIW
jgi:PIN domain nuclease of toxin-antitoxin system